MIPVAGNAGTESREGCELLYLRKQLEGQCGWSLVADDGKGVTEGEVL